MLSRDHYRSWGAVGGTPIEEVLTSQFVETPGPGSGLDSVTMTAIVERDWVITNAEIRAVCVSEDDTDGADDVVDVVEVDVGRILLVPHVALEFRSKMISDGTGISRCESLYSWAAFEFLHHVPKAMSALDITRHLCGGLVAAEGLRIVLRNVARKALPANVRLEFVVTGAKTFGEWIPKAVPCTSVLKLKDETIAVPAPTTSHLDVQVDLYVDLPLSALHFDAEVCAEDGTVLARCRDIQKTLVIHPYPPTPFRICGDGVYSPGLPSATGQILDLSRITREGKEPGDFDFVTTSMDSAGDVHDSWFNERVAIPMGSVDSARLMLHAHLGDVPSPSSTLKVRVYVAGLVHNIMLRRGSANGAWFFF